MLINNMFEKIVLKYPQRTALVDLNNSLSYEELNHKANQLAHYLIDTGLKPQQAVGVLAHRDNNYIIAILAVIKANCFYVPLDPKYPDDRLEFIIDNAELTYIIGSESKLSGILNNFDNKKIYVDNPSLSTFPLTNPDLDPIDSSSNIYILFTSGSTGKPKGVVINHRGVINLVKHFQQTFNPPIGNYNSCQNARLSFDASTLEIWYNLLSGATLYFTPEKILLQPNKLRDWIVEKEIRDILLITPIAEMLFDQKFPADCPFKYLYLGGDALKKLPPADFKPQIVNVYGPTECACITVLDTIPHDYKGPITIGKAIINTRTYILDENLKQVKAGQLGELCLAGDSVGNGYWKLPQQTEQSFVKNQKVNDVLHEEVIYRTGDLVRELEDGRIDFRGRIDFQVKIRGLRIELDEIEKVIHNHKNIDQATVLAVGEGNEKFLVAYYTSKDGEKIDQSEIVAKCQQELPDYMVPQFYLHLAKLPLTANKKVDRRALEDLELPKEDKAIIAPQNPVQSDILDVWKEYLELQTISIDDNFFYIGGHSLKAAQIVNELQNRGYNLELAQFMSNSTIKDLAEIINSTSENQQDIEIIPRDKDYYPITKNQEDLWYLSHLDDSKRIYNILVKCDFIDNIDEKILINSLHLLFQIYESFRSSFKEVDKKIYQFIQAEADLNYELTSITSQDELNRLISEMQSSMIRPNQYPLYEIKLVKFNDKLIMLLNIHHLIFDGWSMQVFINKLSDIYHLLSPELEESIEVIRRVQNVDYANWLKDKTSKFERDQKYWHEQLKPYPPDLHLIPDRKKHKYLSPNGKRIWFSINNDQLKKLSDYAQKNSVSLFSLLLTLYQLVLGEKSNRSDITVAFPYASRSSKTEETLIGYYTNMVIVRSLLNNKDLKELLPQVHKKVMEAISHSSQPFGDLVKSFHLPIDKSKTPLYQAIFVMQNWHGNHKNSIIKSEKELGSNTSKTDIILNAEEIESGMEFWLEYNTDFYEEELINQLKNRLLDLIDRLNPPNILSNHKTCYILTETSLGIKSAELLLEKGFHIYGIISPSKQVRNWANQKGIYSEDLNKSQLTQLLKKYPYDYLFSIVNSILLDKEILASPIKLAINYHDSLLPKYAGLYATYWAIVNNETKHGITWHKVDEGIDTGDIIIQEQVTIDAEDTSSSLNMKCYQAALISFSSLLDSINDNNMKLYQQDLEERSYFASDYRTDYCCALTNDTSIKEAELLYRASFFGENENPVASLKVKFNNNFYHIRKGHFKTLKHVNQNNLDIHDNYCEISLKDGIIVVDELVNLLGDPFEIGNVPKGIEWQSPTEEDIKNYYNGVRNEQYWLKQLASYEPLELPNSQYDTATSSQYLSLDNSDLALYILFLARYSTQSRFSLVISKSEEHPLWMNKLLLNVKVDFNLTVKENLDRIQKSIKKMKRHKALLKSIFYRYPTYKHLAEILSDFQVLVNQALFSTFKENMNTTQLLKEVLLVDETDLALIDQWNSVKLTIPEESSYIELFKQAVSKYSSNIAVEYADHQLTYKDLDNQSNLLANYLYKEIGQGNFIAISTERNLEMIIIIIAILKSGNAYLPIDPDYPLERIKHILENSNCKTIFTDFNYPALSNVKVLSVNNYHEYLSEETAKVSIEAEDIAYIIYTSGTTGKPKGVTVNHKNLINHNLIVQDRYNITSNDRVLQFASISFDISVEEIFPCFLSGASLVLRDPDINKSASQFLDFISSKQITIVNLPTAFWHQIAKSLPEHQIYSEVKTLVIGGEKASEDIYSHWQKHAPKNINLFNTYGPTEATIIATIDEGVDDTIGKVMPNTSIHILDRFLKARPIGTPGKIYIGGYGVTPGYYNNEKLTKEKFVETSTYGRIYDTGDLGYFYKSGKIKFLGRDDDQIKLNGYRIELSEIENSISQHSSLKTVFADVRGKGSNRKIILYYLSNTDIDRNYFITLAKEQLPDYMIPNDFIRITDLPLSPNGKIDKRLLPEPEIHDKIVNVQAFNLYEMKILPLFREVLGKQIGPEDNFFKEGGDSLKAIELIVSLEKAMKMKINSSSLYQHSTVRDLSRFLQEEKQADFSIITPLQSGNKDLKPLFLTHTTPGDVLGYVNLIHALDDRIPVYGIQSQGLSSDVCQTCFRDMVTKYTDEILQVQKEGPFHIGGWCYGGILAFEIGVELKKRGFEDVHLYLIETWGRPNTKFRQISYQLRRLFNAIILGPKFWHSYLHNKLSNFSNIHKVLEEDFIDNITETLGGKSQEDIDKLKRIYRFNIDALNQHVMSNLVGEINLFLAEEPLEGLIPDPKYGWSGMVSNINFYSVKGSHTTVLKHPYVSDISSVISNMLTATKKVSK